MALADDEGLILGCSHSEVVGGPLFKLWKKKFQTRNQKHHLYQCSCKVVSQSFNTSSGGMKHLHLFQTIHCHLRNPVVLRQFSVSEGTSRVFLL